MIAPRESKRNEGNEMDKTDVWARIAAPLPTEAINWRIDGKPIERTGKFFARYVAYVDAQFVRERLDLVVPGEWDLSIELLPPLLTNGDGEAVDEPCAFKARLRILGIIREDVGMGRDYKAAATDAFKRAAVRFGVAAELYGYEANWVQVDGNGRYPKPVEDPSAAYERRYGRERAVTDAAAALNATGATTLPRATNGNGAPTGAAKSAATPANAASAASGAPAADAAPTKPQHDEGGPACPTCGGQMWDNRLTKRNPKAPDFKCRDKGCEGAIWPAKTGRDGTGTRQPASAAASGPPEYGGPIPGLDEDVPF